MCSWSTYFLKRLGLTNLKNKVLLSVLKQALRSHCVCIRCSIEGPFPDPHTLSSTWLWHKIQYTWVSFLILKQMVVIIGKNRFFASLKIIPFHLPSSKMPTRHFSIKNSSLTQAWYLSEWRIRIPNSIIAYMKQIYITKSNNC